MTTRSLSGSLIPKLMDIAREFFESGDIEDDPASKCVVSVGHEKITHKASEVGKVNSPKFEKNG